MGGEYQNDFILICSSRAPCDDVDNDILLDDDDDDDEKDGNDDDDEEDWDIDDEINDD